MLHGWLVPCYGTESQAPFPKFESKVPRLFANAMFWVIGGFLMGSSNRTLDSHSIWR